MSGGEMRQFGDTLSLKRIFAAELRTAATLQVSTRQVVPGLQTVGLQNVRFTIGMLGGVQIWHSPCMCGTRGQFQQWRVKFGAR